MYGTTLFCHNMNVSHEAKEYLLLLCRQLEVLRNSDDGSEKGSLLWLLNHTKTVMGKRLLKTWVAHPSRNVPLIESRLDAVQALAQADGDHHSSFFIYLMWKARSGSLRSTRRQKCLQLCMQIEVTL